MRPRRSPRTASGTCLAAALLAALALAAGACDGADPEVVPPEGAVIQVGSGWLYAEEIERWAGVIALIEPTRTEPHWKRAALTNLVIPRKVGSLLVPEEREAARAAARAARDAAAAGREPPAEGPAVERLSGSFKEVGLDRWGVAHELAPGEWSEVFETIAGFTAVRLVEAPPRETWNGGTPVVIDHVTAYYLRPDEDPRALIADARRQMEIRPVDPDWEWILPKWLEYEQ